MDKFNLTFALWYLRHKRAVDFVALYFVIVINVLIFSYVFVQAKDYLVTPWPEGGEILVKIPERAYKAKPIQVLKSEMILNGDNSYDLVAQLQNPNHNFGASNFNYKFVLTDSIGQNTDVDGVSYILPGEVKYVIRTKVPFHNNNLSQVKFIIGDDLHWLSKKNLVPPTIAVLLNSKKFYINSVGQFELFANLENQSLDNFHTVDVSVVCFGPDQSILAVSYTTINNFFAQSQREFRMSWPKAFHPEINNTIIEVKTNVYDNRNYVDDKGNLKETDPIKINQPSDTEYRDI